MLQISSGKFYKDDKGRINHLRGVIYTNIGTYKENEIKTQAGTILTTSHTKASSTLIYEFTELMENSDVKPGVVVSHGIDPYINDFSTIISFALNCIATPDNVLFKRLISDNSGLSTPAPPNKLILEFFDRQQFLSPEKEQHLVRFTKQLIGLKRKYFLGVMRAIRTYITGMHRIADDIELAYTLMVASLESLAQDFDGYKSKWEDIDNRKKTKIDKVLATADATIADEVRSAILEVEHPALSRRFKEFVSSNINSSYFRENIENIVNPITIMDLPKALNQAYKARSEYVHNLKTLPELLTLGANTNDTTRINSATWLTLQGLSRLVRHVITEFIFKQDQIKKEEYDFSLERSGIVQIPIAPQYWIGKTEVFSYNSGSKRLEGFLSQLADHFLQFPNSQVTDLKKVIEVAEKKLPQMRQNQKQSFITLTILFNGLVAEQDKTPNHEEFYEKYISQITPSSAEALILNLLSGYNLDAIDINHHEKNLMNYFQTRDHKNRFRMPRVFEAGILLVLAERYRMKEHFSDSVRIVSIAVESFPEHSNLRDFEVKFKSNNSIPILWAKILLPIAKEESKEKEGA